MRMSIQVAIIEDIMEVSKKLKIELPFVHAVISLVSDSL